MTSEHLYVASVAVLRAELELRTTDEERLDVLQRWVTAARAQEQAARLAVESGRAPPRALLTSKVDRLDAEIALERAASE